MADAVPTSFLRRKVFGRIPMLYVLLGGAVILAVVAWRLKPATAPQDNTATDSAATDAPPEISDLTPNVDNSGGFVANPQPAQPAAPGNAGIEDNQTWYRKGVEFLVQHGEDSSNAETALSKYLEGEQLSYAEGQLKNKVVLEYGPPPEYFKPGGTQGKPSDPARQQGPLPRNHIVKGPNDDTYADLARLYYSNASAANIALIKAENTPNGLSGDGPWPVGTSVRIPKFIDPVYFTSTKRDNTLSEIASKNGRSTADIQTLNPGMKFPVKPGTRVRVK